MSTLPPSDKKAMDLLFNAVLKTTNDHQKITKAVESNMKNLSTENQTELTPILAEMQKDDMNTGGSLGGNGNQGGYNYSYGGKPLGVSVGPLVNFFENKAAAYGLDMKRLKDLQIAKTVSPVNDPTINNNNPANSNKDKPTTPNSNVELILSVDENKNITIDVHSVMIGNSKVQVGETKEKIIELISGNTQAQEPKIVGGYKKTMKMRRNRRKHKKSKRIHHNKMGKI